MFGVDHRGGFSMGWIPKGSVLMTLPGSSALSVPLYGEGRKSIGG